MAIPVRKDNLDMMAFREKRVLLVYMVDLVIW